MQGAFAILAFALAAWLQGCGGGVCALLKVTAEVSAMADSFCNGDLSPIMDQFEQLFMGLVSDVTGTPCESLGDYADDRWKDVCQTMAAVAGSALSQEDCSGKTGDVTTKMVEECTRQAESLAEKWIDQAGDASKRKARQAYKKKLTRGSRKQAKATKNKICAASPVVAGLSSSMHQSNCVEVVADVFIGCAEVTDHPIYNEMSEKTSFRQAMRNIPDGTRASRYNYRADPAGTMGGLWGFMHASHFIYMNQRDIPPYNDPIYTDMIRQAGKANAGIAYLSVMLENAGFKLEDAYDDPEVASKLTAMTMWNKNAAEPTFCDFTFTTTLNSELTMEQIIAKANSTARVANIFYEEMSQVEWTQFEIDTAKACAHHTGYSTWLQMSDHYAEPLNVYSCASNIVTYERDLEVMELQAS